MKKNDDSLKSVGSSFKDKNGPKEEVKEEVKEEPVVVVEEKKEEPVVQV